MDPRLASNRRWWDQAARLHASGRADYPVDRVKKRRWPWSTPLPDAIGPVRGKSLLHLQCHFGMDSLAWAWKGAAVTGADFSPRAIAEARKLSRISRIPARFVRANVYDLPRALDGRFDIVLTYYGTICWLPDMNRWAKVVAHFLKPGGFFYIADGHPFTQAIEFDRPRDEPRLAYSYFPSGPDRYESTGGTYSIKDAKMRKHVLYEWRHSLHEIVDALRAAGLAIDYVHEYPYAFWNLAYYTGRDLMKEDRRGFWHLKGWEGKLPLMFSIRAVKPR